MDIKDWKLENCYFLLKILKTKWFFNVKTLKTFGFPKSDKKWYWRNLIKIIIYTESWKKKKLENTGN